MITLFCFGQIVEQYLTVAFGSTAGAMLYVALYVSAIGVSVSGGLVI